MEERPRIILAGCNDAAKHCLDYLVQRAEVPAVMTSDRESMLPIMREGMPKYASDLGLKVYTDNRSDDYRFLEELGHIDALFSVFYDRRIKKPLLDHMPCFNIHGGLLPNYRGCYSNMWSIINGEQESGATAHTMTEDFDSGLRVGEIRFPLEDCDTGHSTYYKTQSAATLLFQKVLDQFLEGKLNYEEIKGPGRYYNKILPNAGVLNHLWRPELIHRYVRAFHFPPFKPAYFKMKSDNPYLQGYDKLEVYKTEIVGNSIIITDGRIVR